MKRFFCFFIIIIFLTIGIPLLFLIKTGPYKKPLPEEEATISVYIKEEDAVKEMILSEYLKEVVSAEMPASFEEEALKAQAVAARTYVESRRTAYQNSEKPPEHKGADICTDYSHCKAWISKEKRMESWGADAEKNWEKISKAVTDTSGEIVTYNGGVISAVFHSTSSGKTENSKDVWGGERAYLVSVESPGEENAPKFKSEKIIPRTEFIKTISDNIQGVDLNAPLIGEITRSEAGGIIEITIMNQKVKGTLLRTLFSLNSTNAEIYEEGENVRFSVKGYGHGVGMSQYGANAMALNGKNYKEILTHYYQGTEITKR
ncbi:MAG: stage II sporulation protein D [Clostridia bacterium]|nr:stage II sporulation protein D [Clostridia bacterium]